MKKLLLTLFSVIILQALQAQTLQVNQFASGFSYPLGVENCGDSRLFVVQQRGLIRILQPNGTINATPFLNVSSLVDQTGDERGLLGLAFHPNYATNGYFYIYYTKTGTHATQVSRFSVDPNNADLALANSEFPILNVAQPYSNHNGGPLAFGPDGYLYIGLGDGGSQNDPNGNGQNKNVLLAKILRIDVDNGNPYAVPSDNPFVGVPNTKPEIWAYGLRNPWRISFDRILGNLWIADVGQNNAEEVNFQLAGSAGGQNYGWKCREGLAVCGTCTNLGSCPASGYTDPIFTYDHSSPNGCSITGGYVYRGAEYGALFGHYLFTDYCSGRIWNSMSDGVGGFLTVSLGDFTQNEYTSFGEDYLGELYLVERYSGIIDTISTAECQPTAFIRNGDVNLCGSETVELSALTANGLTYQWLFNGGNIGGANSSTYTTSTPGTYAVIVSKSPGCFTQSPGIGVSVNPLPTVSFTGLDANYCVNYSPVQLAPTPAGGTFSGPGVSGTSFDPAVAGVGSHNITYSYTDGNGCTNTAVTGTVVSACTGINEASVFSRMNLYPNPAQSNLTVEFVSGTKTNIVINLYTATGQLVKTESRKVDAGMQRLTWDVSTLQQGVYYIELNAENGKAVKHFTVSK